MLRVFQFLILSVLLAVGSVALFGCSASPVASPELDQSAKKFSVPAGKSRIYVYRDQFVGSAVGVDVTLNSQYVGTLLGYTYIYVDVIPGEYRLQSETSSVELDVETGHMYYVWQEIKWGPRTVLHVVNTQKGQDGVRSGKLLQADLDGSARVRPIGATPKKASPAVVQPSKDRELVAVLGVVAEGKVSQEQASAVTDRLREQLIKAGAFRVVDRDQLDSILSEQALQQTGCTSTECAVKVGKILGARKMFAGRLIRLNENLWQLSQNLIDVETSETTRAETIVEQGSFYNLLTDGTDKLVGRLVAR